MGTLQRAILLTIVYSDLFDYPLTADELRRYLPVPDPGDRVMAEVLDELIPETLARRGDFLFLSGRDSIVGMRLERDRTTRQRWPQAQRYARWLRHVPFVRMVAVCGSQAAGNSRPDADIDFFIITEAGRLWTAQIFVMFLRRFASLFSVSVCPNYFLSLDSLQVSPRDLYHAREIAQAVPLWGEGVYRRFREANRWVDDLLPNLAHADDRSARLLDLRGSSLAAAFEWLLRGRTGDGLEGGIHRLLLRYYAIRLRRRGWRREQLRRAYRPDRQEVVRGGYGPIVENAFRRRVHEELPDSDAARELQRFFPDPATVEVGDRLYRDQFATRYRGER